MSKIKININYKGLIIILILIIISIFVRETLKSFVSSNFIIGIITLVFILIIIYYLPNIIGIKNGKDKRFDQEIIKAKNFLRILFFVIFVIYIIILAVKDPILGVASGTIIGLVLGLALQPILSNLFSGLIIFLSGYIRVGDKIRILVSQIPYQSSIWPAYKFFSEDAIPIGYKGYVEEIGIVYTKIVLVSGVRLKIPNSIVLNSGIIEKESLDQTRLVKIRFEFPIRKIKDFNSFLNKIEEKIRKIKGVKKAFAVYSEQCDKENIIVELKVDTHASEHKIVKSEILKELMKIWKKLNEAPGGI